MIQNHQHYYSLEDIASKFGGELLGNYSNVQVGQVASLANASAGQITFVASDKFVGLLAGTEASAVVVSPKHASATELPRIVCQNPYAYYARLVRLFNPPLVMAASVHPSAIIDSVLPKSTCIGAHVVIGKGVTFGERVVVHPGVVVGDDVAIGDDSVLYPNCTIYPDCLIGRRAIIHSGAVIGGDGFGFAQENGQWLKIPQIGRVVIGDDVEIGANTTIDRGALEDTLIGNDVKLDNQIQIAHNVAIGDHTAMAGCVGVAGSTKIGSNCTVGGAGMIVGHLDICDKTHISAGTLVTKSIKIPGKYTSIFPIDNHANWVKTAAQLKRLVTLAERVTELEKKIKELESNL